jgi:serine/threonine protein kinase
MTENIHCSTCGAITPSGMVMGQCPKCLLGLGVTASEDSTNTQPPRCFAGYELVHQIGRGGMGVVYEARQTRLNRTVALKMILSDESCSPTMRRRFFIEAEAVARLDHPNIVPLYEVGEFEGAQFLSMKLIQGESLRKKMARGELGLPKNGELLGKASVAHQEKKIGRLVATLAHAIHHAHGHNVVHRDLKPGNILLDAGHTPYVTDFGLAKILDSDQSQLSGRTEMMGTLAYMSPQQVRSDAVSPATDIYSLGVILYELLAGQLPFHGVTPNETLRLIETQPPRRLRLQNRFIHPDLEIICLKCLEKEPRNRYVSAAELAEDLERWLANQTIKAKPAGCFVHLHRWIKRNPLGTTLILSLMLTLFAVFLTCIQLSKNAQLEAENSAYMYNRWVIATELLWKSPQKTSLTMPAEEIARVRGRHSPNLANAIRLILEVNITENPVAQAQAFAPLLDYLQNTMGAVRPPVGWARLGHWFKSWFSHRQPWQLAQPVAFDLKFCKYSSLSFHEIAAGQAHFQRLGAVGYERARELDSNVLALVQEDAGKEAVIFVRQDSPITNLVQFAGRSFAFGDTNSTINLWAKVHLVKAGVQGTNQPDRGRNLKHYKVFDELPVYGVTDFLDENAGGLNLPVSISNMEAARSVLEGEFDGAVLQRRYFDHLKWRKPGLREIFSFTITPNVYVARADLDPAIVRAFREAMISLNNPALLVKLPIKPPIQRFQVPDESEFLKLRTALTNEVLVFEGTKSVTPTIMPNNPNTATPLP